VSASVLKTSVNRNRLIRKNARRIVDLLTKIKNERNKFARAAAQKPSSRSIKKAVSPRANASQAD